MQSGNSQRRAARSPQRLRVWVTRLPRLVARSPRRVARSPSMAAPRDPWGEGSWTTLSLRLGDPNDLSLLIKSRAAPLANGVSNHIRLSSFLPLSSYPPPSGASHISHGPFTLTFPRSDFTYYLSSLSFFLPFSALLPPRHILSIPRLFNFSLTIVPYPLTSPPHLLSPFGPNCG